MYAFFLLKAIISKLSCAPNYQGLKLQNKDVDVITSLQRFSVFFNKTGSACLQLLPSFDIFIYLSFHSTKSRDNQALLIEANCIFWTLFYIILKLLKNNHF